MIPSGPFLVFFFLFRQCVHCHASFSCFHDPFILNWWKTASLWHPVYHDLYPTKKTCIPKPTWIFEARIQIYMIHINVEKGSCLTVKEQFLSTSLLWLIGSAGYKPRHLRTPVYPSRDLQAFYLPLLQQRKHLQSALIDSYMQDGAVKCIWQISCQFRV